MGASFTRTALERRNTVVRRSQKRTLMNVEQKAEKLIRDIRKFKGTSQYDEHFHALKTKLVEIREFVEEKTDDIVPPVRAMHARALERLKEADILLDNKLKENIEKEERAEKRKAEKVGKKKEKDEDKDETKEEKGKDDQTTAEAAADTTLDDLTIEELERQRDETASPLSSIIEGSLVSVTSKNKKAEVSFAKADSLDTIDEAEKTPQETRRSIMKLGIQVMPPNISNEIANRKSTNSPKSSRESFFAVSTKSTEGAPTPPPKPLKDKPIGSPRATRASVERSSVSSKIDENQNKVAKAANDAGKLREIKHQVQALEEEISQFSGRKDGIQYNKIKDKLFDNLDLLLAFPDKEDAAYNQLKRYIDSCLSFLDEKAVSDDDDVFLPPEQQAAAQTIFQNGYKITQI